MQTGHQLRRLFAIILLHCRPAQPHILWDLNKVKICDDLRHMLIAEGHLDPTEEDVFDYGLHLLQDILIDSGKHLDKYPNMPLPQQQWNILVANPILQEQLAYKPGLMARMVDDCYPHFNQEQKQAFGKVLDPVNNDKGKIFFLHSAGGCGKTHICNTMATAVHAQGKVTLCVASSAIAALLLDGG